MHDFVNGHKRFQALVLTQIHLMQFRDHAAQVCILWTYVPVIESAHNIYKRELTSACFKILTRKDMKKRFTFTSEIFANCSVLEWII